MTLQFWLIIISIYINLTWKISIDIDTSQCKYKEVIERFDGVGKEISSSSTTPPIEECIAQTEATKGE